MGRCSDVLYLIGILWESWLLAVLRLPNSLAAAAQLAIAAVITAVIWPIAILLMR